MPVNNPPVTKVSQLSNDLNFLVPGNNISQLTNNSGFITTTPVKALCLFTGTTGAFLRNSGFSSVSRIGPGYYTVTFSSAMPDTNYAILCNAELGSTGQWTFYIEPGFKGTSNFRLSIFNGTTQSDPTTCHMAALYI